MINHKFILKTFLVQLIINMKADFYTNKMDMPNFT